MTSKVKSDGMQYSSCRVNLPSLQRSQAIGNEHRNTQVFNSATSLDSGAGTVCSSVDVNKDTNTTECVSLVNTHKPGEDAVCEVYGGRGIDFINKGCNIETLPSEKGVESEEEANICSEEDVLNFTFKVCDKEGTGKVSTSVIVRYLQEMTGQSYKFGRLHVLYNMLDPDKRDVAVDCEQFHSTMKRWIATCCQKGPSDDKADMREHSSVQSMDGEETSCVMVGTLEEEMGSSKIYFQSDHTFTKRIRSFSSRENNELISDVADLKYANQKLREQNASLQKAMELSDETNLQLTKELSKLKGQLMRYIKENVFILKLKWICIRLEVRKEDLAFLYSQSSLRSLRSMLEDLEEAKTTGRDAQEKVCQLQAHCKELKKENEVLVAQLWAVFEKNEKIEKDMRKLNYKIDELLTENADLTKQIHEAQKLLISKDALIFEETVLIEELKMSNEESCKIIEGLRAELKASQEKVCQDFFGCKIGLTKSSLELPMVCPVQSEMSLQLEIQDSQKAEETEGLPNPVCGLMPLKDQRDFFQEIFSHTKAKKHSSLFQKTVDEMELKKELKQTMLDIVQRLHLLAPIKESWEKSMEKLEQVSAECQRQYFNTEHNLANTIRELELQKILREEAEEKAADAVQSAEEAKAKEKAAIIARTLESKKVKKALEDMTAADEELTRARNAAMETEGKLLESNKKLAEVKEKLSLSEFALFELQQKVNEDNERTNEAREKMMLALEMAEKRVETFETKTREMEKKIEETKQIVAVAELKAAAEEQRATGFLAELERVKEETERVKEHARETLLESSKKMSAMEDRVAEVTEMLAAVQHKASSAQCRAAMAEERLLAILVSAKRAVKKINFPAENATEGIQVRTMVPVIILLEFNKICAIPIKLWMLGIIGTFVTDNE
ncbi:inositol 1,4,5-triphosphate receptor associated 2-like [Rhincodon typus]|uniref:inositol 1,4,5-triphosphate receptor associated 2-like n=1 Tax=Rhincodon typus TaxID=259920 RepID=UPI00202DD906|nr:inositol 1,4,5-triphosphate receptor associated 2-like [Rhincodon typus]